MAYGANMTKLEAVNICLAGLGEAPLTDLDAESGLDTVMILQQLDMTSLHLQNRGWHWNTEVAKFHPVNGVITLPTTVARADATDKSLDVVLRGTQLYDKKFNRYIFAGPVELEVVSILPFEQLPSAAQLFVAHTAAMYIQQKELGSDSLNNFLKETAQAAWRDLVRADTLNSDHNMLSGSWSTQRILLRDRFPRGGAR